MAVTITDVSRAAGVSKGAVSRVLNNKGGAIDISPKTQARIMKVVRELNYRPNASARALATGRYENIGAVLGKGTVPFSSYLYPEIFEGISGVLMEREYNLTIVLQHTAGTARECGIPKIVLDANVDGLVLLSRVDPELVEYLENGEIPHVFVNTQVVRDSDCVVPDDEDGVFQAVRYLTGLGHERIAFLRRSDDPDDHCSVAARYHGYLRGLREAGIEFRESLVKPGEETYAQVKELLEKDHPPTAIVTYSHPWAFEAIQAITACGLRVPEDVSVIGCDDSVACQYGNPPLTAVSLPAVELGMAGAKMLLEKIKDNGRSAVRRGRRREMKTVVLPETLVVRGSCAPPPP